MEPQAGMFLKSSEALQGSFFENTVIMLTSSNAQGAIGFVVNKPFEHRLNELEEFKHCRPFPMYDGGPVDREHLFFIHRRPDIIEEAGPIGKGLYLGGRFDQAVEAINNQSMGMADIKLFIGYCGWDAGELEAEIAEGSWEIHDGIDVFMP